MSHDHRLHVKIEGQGRKGLVLGVGLHGAIGSVHGDAVGLTISHPSSINGSILHRDE